MWLTIRGIISVFRGDGSPTMAALSVLLGFCFGFVPGFSGIHFLLLLLLILLNIPLNVFILSSLLAKSLALIFAKALYDLGVVLTEPLAAIIASLEQIPIVGLTNFQRPAIIGALTIGPIIGIILGVVLAAIILGFRHTWLSLEENTQTFKTWKKSTALWILDWIVFGASAKDAKTALTAKTSYFRTFGIFVFIVLCLLALAISMFIQSMSIRYKITQALTNLNGATVNINSLNFLPLSGVLQLKGLEVTNPEKTTENALQVKELGAETDLYHLSIGKAVIEQVTATEVSFDRLRTTPGQILPKPKLDIPSIPSKSKQSNWPDIERLDVNKLEDYLAKAENIKKWLEKIYAWLPDTTASPKPPSPPQPAHYLDYLSLVRPTKDHYQYLVKVASLEKVRLDSKLFGISTIQLHNITDAPHLTNLPVRLLMQAEHGPILGLTLHYASATAPGKIEGKFSGLDIAALQQVLKPSQDLQFQSGQITGTFQGSLNPNDVHLKAAIQLKNVQIVPKRAIFGLSPQIAKRAFSSIDNLQISMYITGSVTDPRVQIDTKKLWAKLKSRAINIGKQQAQQVINRQLEKHRAILPKGVADDIGKGLHGLFNRR